MADWTWLPNELKFEIIKQLDFITRFRFRHTSLSSLILVDYIPFYIPRIYLNFTRDTDIHMLIFESASLVRQFRFFRLEGGTQYFSTTTYNPSTVTASELQNPKVPQKRRSKYTVIPQPIYAFTCALKTITSASSKTILGGIDIFGYLSFEGDAEVMRLLEGCRIRARILTVDDKLDALPILMRCTDVVEIHEPDFEKEILFDDRQRNAKVRVITASVSWMRYKSSEMDAEWLIENRYGDGDVKDKCGIYQEIGPNQYLYGDDNDLRLELFDTPCGLSQRKLPMVYIEEEPQECPRRRACKKHSDLFEYWYFNEKRTFYDGTEVVTRSGWNNYEYILPVINGKCPVKQCMDKMNKRLKKWKVLAEKDRHRWWNRVESEQCEQQFVWGWNLRTFLEKLTLFWVDFSVSVLVLTSFLVLIWACWSIVLSLSRGEWFY